MSGDTTNKKRTPTTGVGAKQKQTPTAGVGAKQKNEPRPQGSGLNSPKAKGIFITGTDTGVGKTLIAGAVAKIISQSGKRVGVFKPVATGCRKTKAGLVSEDAEFLKRCTNTELGLEIINPMKFAKPAAPFACEKAENRKTDLKKIADAYKKICRESDFVIVEGIGGIKVPITAQIDVLKLAKAFKLPVVIVARSKLGTINHTLLTIDVVRRAGLSLAGVVINGYDEKTKDFAEKTNARIIEKLGKVKILTVVPFDKKTNMKKFIIGRKILKSLKKVNWLKIK
jgi:dethiobiotin synthetase